MEKVSRESPFPTRSGFLFLLGGLFFLSGATGLVYEVAWFRLLFLKLGGTGLSVATVTAAFMTGLGVGAWGFGTRIAKGVPPVRLYAYLEGFIGLYALAVPSLVGLAGRLDVALLGGEAEGGVARLVRFLLAGMVLLPPTICMGGTLPALARLVEEGGHRPGRFVGVLYGLNTTGAVLGAGGAGFYLMPRVGFSRTVMVCAAGNLVLALVAFLLSRWREARLRPPEGAGGGVEGKVRRPVPELGVVRGRPVLALFAYTASGFIAFMLQVSWTRILTLVFASSVYAFSFILVIFLAGLGVGALLSASLFQRCSPVRGLSWTFVVVGSVGLLGEGLYGRLPYLFLSALMEAESGLALGRAALLAGVLMLPATLALGAGFPLAVRLATGDGRPGVAARVGGLYAGNTGGSVLGAFLTALVLIPVLGLAGVVSLASLLGLGVGVYLALVRDPRPAGTFRRGSWAAVGAALVAAAVWFSWIPGWNRNLMSESVAFWRGKIRTEGKGVWELLDLVRRNENPRLLFYRDGITATVAVKLSRPTEGPENHFLTVDGKVDASSVGDMPTQVMLGQLPLLAAFREVEDVLVVGLGSGVTVGSVLTHPVSSVLVVEIEEATVPASRFFDHVNGRPLEDPRTRLIFNDARAYLARTDRRFDVIISEPSSVWLSGSARLFTREAFDLFRSRLAPGGILCQWLQTYDMDEESFLTVVRTIRDVFPHVALFSSKTGDLILLASGAPIRFTFDGLKRAWSVPAVRDDLHRADLKTPCALLDHLLMDLDAVEIANFPGTRNTDDNTLLEHRGPRTVGHLVDREVLEPLRGKSRQIAGLLADLAPSGEIDPGKLAVSCFREKAPDAAESFAHHRLKTGPDADSFWVLGELEWARNRRLQALDRFDAAIRLAPDHEFSLISRAVTLQDLGRWQAALTAWDLAMEKTERVTLVLSYRGILRLDMGDVSGALRDLSEAKRRTGGMLLPLPVGLHLARVYLEMGRMEDARLQLEDYLGRLPEEGEPTLPAVAARERLAELLEGSGGDRKRVEALRRRARTERQGLSESILEETATRLDGEGEGSARTYLIGLSRMDPGLQAELQAEMQRGSEAGKDFPESLLVIVLGL